MEAVGAPRALSEKPPPQSDLSLAGVVAQEIEVWSIFDIFVAEDLGMKLLNVALEIIVRTFGAIIVGIVYYFRVVKEFPKVKEDSKSDSDAYAHHLMSAPECEGCGMATSVIGCCALLCPAPRLAHTLHSANKMNYWLALILSTFLQPCMVLYGSGFTSLRQDLGGDGAANMKCQRNCCAFWCSCCVIAKQAQALDMKVGWRTSWFGASPLIVDEDGEYMNINMAAIGSL